MPPACPLSAAAVCTMALARCPLCDRPFDPEHSPARPFCSERCRWVDLNRWLEESYGLAHEPEEEPKDTEAET
ncbi:MAG: hypothetical protein A2V70_01095 [Planctomycetes bacterium RBG_13_63_9]|nr:MAG: hypothetical protein A2V70_01095 [Planctomycetes bacterium RBG_13_63_9]